VHRIVTNNIGEGISDEFKQHLKGDYDDFEEYEQKLREERAEERKKKAEAEPKKKKRKKRKLPPYKKPATKKAVATFKKIANKLDEATDVDDPESEDLFEKLMSQGMLNPGEQLKIAQTALANLRIAKEMDDLITKQMVVQCFARLSGIMSSRLLCLGQRAAKQLCGIFDQTSPEKEIEVQKVLDDEVASAVEAIQKEISDAVDW
jgi:hypothetical protein